MSKRADMNFLNDNSRLIRILVGVSLAIMSVGTFLSAYLQQGYTETISFFVRDGWCNQRSQGIGAHCFGDFYAPMTIASNSNPWSNDLNLAYTPISFLYFRLLNSEIINNIGTHLSIFINLLFTFLALSIPGLYIWKNQKNFQSVSGKWVLLICLTAAPSLIMIDRGSSSFLMFPAVFFFYLGIQTSKYSLASWSLILMGLWKPQSLILAVGILIFFGIKPFVVALAKFVLIFSASFFLYPVGFFRNILDYLENSSEYQNYLPIPTPGNYSLINFLGFLNGGVNFVAHGFRDLRGSFRSPMDESVVSIFCAVYALLVISLFLITRRKISKFQFVIFSSAFMLTIPGTVYGYYLSLMLIPLIVLSKEQVTESLVHKENRITWKIYCILLFSSVPAWPVNWGNLPISIGDSWSTLGVHWSFVHVIVSVLVLVSMHQLLILSFNKMAQSRE
jgi:hypothetical protein